MEGKRQSLGLRFKKFCGVGEWKLLKHRICWGVYLWRQSRAPPPPPGAEKGFSSQGGERGSCESSDATSETGLGILTACTSPSQQALWGGEVAVTPDEMSDLGRRRNLWLRSRVRLKGVGERRETASERSLMPSTAQGE